MYPAIDFAGGRGAQGDRDLLVLASCSPAPTPPFFFTFPFCDALFQRLTFRSTAPDGSSSRKSAATPCGAMSCPRTLSPVKIPVRRAPPCGAMPSPLRHEECHRGRRRRRFRKPAHEQGREQWRPGAPDAVHLAWPEGRPEQQASVVQSFGGRRPRGATATTRTSARSGPTVCARMTNQTIITAINRNNLVE